MIPPDVALARLLALARAVEIETVPLRSAAGRWSAAPILACRNQPACDLSAMDGYAIRFADLPGALRVIGAAAAGMPFGGLIGVAQAARIFTGAALPRGADTVVVQEDVAASGDYVTLIGTGPNAAGAHVRHAGSDFQTGNILIDAGEPLTAARIGLAAIGGLAAVPVRRCLRIALISTGNELIPIGTATTADQLPSSNAVMLEAMLDAFPVDITDFGIIADDRAALATAFRNAGDFDIIVSTGGASVGDHDLVHVALHDAGATIDFWKIAMRPGKPLMAGRLGKAVVLGLPGNPVSAFVTATLFLQPLIAHVSGASSTALPIITARLGADLPVVGDRTDFIRAQWLDGAIVPLAGSSGMLVPLAAAQALIIRHAGSPIARSGSDISIILLT